MELERYGFVITDDKAYADYFVDIALDTVGSSAVAKYSGAAFMHCTSTENEVSAAIARLDGQLTIANRDSSMVEEVVQLMQVQPHFKRRQNVENPLFHGSSLESKAKHDMVYAMAQSANRVFVQAVGKCYYSYAKKVRTCAPI